MKRLRITVEGKSYDVTVEELGDGPSAVSASAARPAIAAPADERAADASDGGETPVVSPLAGTVVSVAVEAGQAVAAGDTVVVIEAMKMNTSIVAPRDGTVTSVTVAAGAAVEEGQTLVTLG